MTAFVNKNKQDVAVRFSRAAASYASYSLLQEAIAESLLSGFTASGTVLDAGCGQGRDAQRLLSLNNFERNVERVIALDLSWAMLKQLSLSPHIAPLCADIEHLPLACASVNAVFSNFAMQWCQSPQQALQEAARVLKPGGSMSISVPGPGSLAALSASGLHVNHFATAAMWQQAFVQAGFEQLHIKEQDFALHYPDARALLAALKNIGAGSVDSPRRHCLQGKSWWQSVLEQLEGFREPEGLPLRYRVIFLSAKIK